jgi:adenylate kinase
MNQEPYPRTVIVCGISGVGKTHLIRSVLAQLPNAVTWSASEIIGEARGNTNPEYLHTLPTDELARSQEMLVRSFAQRREEARTPLILLDAHCVLDTDGGIFEIETQVMRRLAPEAFVHVEDHVGRILERRAQDTQRRRPARSLEQLQQYQDRSRQVCRQYEAALRRPMIQLYSGDSDGLLRAIRALARSA